ncbi:MAG TPA: sterol desaturase [Flavobacteriales bacterium]|nr:sterol desaturase [Flavobacteriales bacterium]
MEEFLEKIIESYSGYANYLWQEITLKYTYKPWYENYFYLLIIVSLFVWTLEVLFPWRKKQPLIRKDFWLDTFYMFFNFFLFNLIIFNALSNTFEFFLQKTFHFKPEDIQLFQLEKYPIWIQLLIFFIITDFVQWFTHILLHRVSFLWEFHKVHHSVEQMGFAAHLRYHWMETVVYKSMLYLPVAIIGGWKFEDVFWVHTFAILIGHLNHANVHITYGPLKYILNNPVMHLWHHAYHLPEGRKYGLNYGISLSLWDYIFGTAEIPKDDGEIKLGFPGVEEFPKDFIGQELHGFAKRKKDKN